MAPSPSPASLSVTPSSLARTHSSIPIAARSLAPLEWMLLPEIPAPNVLAPATRTPSPVLWAMTLPCPAPVPPTVTGAAITLKSTPTRRRSRGDAVGRDADGVAEDVGTGVRAALQLDAVVVVARDDVARSGGRPADDGVDRAAHRQAVVAVAGVGRAVGAEADDVALNDRCVRVAGDEHPGAAVAGDDVARARSRPADERVRRVLDADAEDVRLGVTPSAPTPMKFPWTVEFELPIPSPTPCSPLPEMTLRAPVVVPPMRVRFPPLPTETPRSFGSAFPAASSPSVLPSMIVPSAPPTSTAAAIGTPAVCPAMRLPAPAAVPPTWVSVVVDASLIPLSFATTSAPPASSPIVLPWMRRSSTPVSAVNVSIATTLPEMTLPAPAAVPPITASLASCRRMPCG